MTVYCIWLISTCGSGRQKKSSHQNSKNTKKCARPLLLHLKIVPLKPPYLEALYSLERAFMGTSGRGLCLLLVLGPPRLDQGRTFMSPEVCKMTS